MVFCIGLLLAALVVEQFEDVLEHHVELSFFVPLIMGHGGNTGSQAVTTVIRCVAIHIGKPPRACKLIAWNDCIGCCSTLYLDGAMQQTTQLPLVVAMGCWHAVTRIC